MTLLELLACAPADAVWLRSAAGDLTFGEADALSDNIAGGLDVDPGDRIAVCLQNDPETVLAWLGAWKAGATVVSVSPLLRAHEVELLVKDSDARLLIDDVDAVRRLTRSVKGRQARTELAFLTYTSGTTGPSKGAMNSHANVLAGGETYRDICGLGPDDVIAGLAPLFHVTGISGHVAASIAAGCTLELGHRFEVSSAIAMLERSTFTVAAVTALSMVRHSGERPDLSRLTKLWSGGQAVPTATAQDLEDWFGSPVNVAYGMTETTYPTHMTDPARATPVREGVLSVGRVTPGASSQLADDGEVLVRGPGVVSGYWERPEESRSAFSDGWLRTGDVGVVEDGWLYLVDRKKDLIVTSGFKVWPREVEEVLASHPAVREAAVIGVPDERTGEAVAAWVSLIPGATTAPPELVEFCRSRLAAYRYPRQITIVDELPKTPSGKVLRRALRDT